MGKAFEMMSRRTALLAVLLLMLMGLAGCGGGNDDPTGRPNISKDLLSQQPQSSVTVFYLAEDNDILIPQVYGVNSTRDTVWIALEKLLAGPADGFCRAVLPQGIKMKDLYEADGVITVTLTGDVELPDDLTTAAEAMYATVNRELTEQGRTMNALQIYYNDEALFDEPYTLAAVNDFAGGKAGSYVYFTDSQAMYVVPVYLPIKESTSGYLNALLGAWVGNPPAKSGLYSAVPKDLQINGVALNDGVLTIDFNSRVMAMNSSNEQKLFVDSLLATLFNVNEVQTVQVMVDGVPYAEALALLTSVPGDSVLAEPVEVPHGDYSFNVVNR